MKVPTLRWLFACATLAPLGACSLALPSSELSNGVGEADAGGSRFADAAEPREDSAVVLDAAVDGSLDAAPEGGDTRDAAKPDAASPREDTDASSGDHAGNEVEPEPVSERNYTTGNITGFRAKCLEAASTSDAAQLWQCDPSRMQQRWEIRIDDDKTLRASGKCLAVEFGASADGTPVTLSPCDRGIAQRWTYGQGLIKHDASGKCLDVKDLKSADGTPMQLWTCSSRPQQNWRLPSLIEPSNSMFGQNVYVFDSSSSREAIQRQLNLVFREQETNQFGEERFLILFKPGVYSVDINVGFYTHVAGLGASPDDVQIQGAVHAEADWWGQRDGPTHNATQNFWRTAENLSVTPPLNADRWAVSQASAYRRMHLRGDLRLDDGGWASGGFIADSWIEGTLLPGKQQQWLTRNSEFLSWQQPSDSGWNMVFVGDIGAPATSFPKPPLTTIDLTPVIREKPFLSIDAQDNYRVFVPPLRSGEQGTSWAHATPNLSPLALDQFAIIRPGERAGDEMNQALEAGKHLLVMPGVYHLTRPIEIKRPDTVVLGLGLPTFVADNGAMVVSIEDVDGVKLAGLIIDAGEMSSPLLMQVGAPGSKTRHIANPTSLHDLYFRIGGARLGKAAVSLEIHSADVITDNMWLWRADHQDENAPITTTGWAINTADHGLIVRGDQVTVYGLFVEHYQKFHTQWFGAGGRTYFYMNEAPYDVPTQDQWMNGTVRGYPTYLVDANVLEHEAWGLGSYCFFSFNNQIVLDHAFEAPVRAGVQLTNMLTQSIGGKGTIRNVVNDQGGAADMMTNQRSIPPDPASPEPP